MALEHYAEVWTAEGDRCWRYVREADTTKPVRCALAPEWIGQHRDGAGRWHTVRSCAGHRGGLERARRI